MSDEQAQRGAVLARVVALVSAARQQASENYGEGGEDLALAALEDDIRAELSQTRDEVGSGWQPIETAPKDETPVLLWDGTRVERAAWSDHATIPGPAKGSGSAWVVSRHPDSGWCCEAIQHPTHWRPLPDPPRNQPRHLLIRAALTQANALRTAYDEEGDWELRLALSGIIANLRAALGEP